MLTTFDQARGRSRRLVLAFGASALCLSLSGLVQAAEPGATLVAAAMAEPAIHAFDIDAQSLDQALAAFARQAGIEVRIDPPGLSADRVGQAVKGQMSNGAALRQILAGSGLGARFTAAGQVVVGAQASQSALTLNPVSVLADRTERPVAETAATVSVLERAELDDKNLQRMKDLVKDQPGIAVSSDPHRAGAGGYNIRGIDDNRILMLVDGTKLPDLPGGVLLRDGGFTPYTRDVVDMDALKRVEILRGPASALYGSEALGGVVGYVTKDPEDYLRAGRNLYGSAKVAYDSKDRSLAETATAAARVDDFSALAVYTRRDGEDVKTDYKLRNAQDWMGNNVLGKLVWDHGVDRVNLTGEYFQRQVDSEMYGSRSNTYPDVDGDDETKRWRVSIGHSHDDKVGFVDQLSWKVYYTNLDRSEDRKRTRTSGWEDYLQSSEQSIWGGEAQFASSAKWFGLDHALTYGLSGDYTKTERLREYVRYNANGTVFGTTTPDGAPTPSRFFPNTETLQGGLFGQDEVTLGAFSVIPGLRLDYYHMEPKTDFYYLRNPATQQAKEVEEFALSPKLGMVYRVNPVYSVYGQYAHGFRAPPYDDANTGFTNTVGPISYEFLPNPDLKAETSNGVELGFRANYADGSSFHLASFYTRYKDYIDMLTIAAPSMTVKGKYQATNLDAVEIYGAEASGLWRFMPDWALRGAAAYAEGEDKETGNPIDSVAPLTLTAGLTYDAPSAAWGAGLDARHVFRHAKVSSADYYRTKSYTTVDFNAYYHPLEWMTLRAGVENLLDAHYVDFADVQKLTPGTGDSAIDAFAGAGRTFNLSATLYW